VDCRRGAEDRRLTARTGRVRYESAVAKIKEALFVVGDQSTIDDDQSSLQIAERSPQS
jgi:hypothetical protein